MTAAGRPAAGTVIVGASGIVVAGIGAAFWSLLTGLVLHAVLSGRARRGSPT